MRMTMCVLFCSTACLLPAAAETPAAGLDPVVRELAGIRASLAKLTGLLEEGRAGRQADLLMRRIGRKEARLSSLESRLRSARERKASDEEQLAQIEAYRISVEKELRLARDRGEPVQAGEAERQILQVEVEEQRFKDRLDRAETRIRELEDEVAESREAVEDLDLRLDEILALMDESD